RSAREQYVGEPAGRAPHIQRHRTAHIEAEMRQPMVKLDPPARNPWMVLTAHFQRRVPGKQFASLGELLLAAEHRPRHDQRLRAATTLRQPPADEKLICADFGHLRFVRKRGPPCKKGIPQLSKALVDAKG